MAGFARVTLSHRGMAEVLQSGEVAAAIGGLAESVASAARQDPNLARHGAEVDVGSWVSDRAVASVVVMSPIGVGLEAKYGPLTRAAGSAGLSVRERGS